MSAEPGQPPQVLPPGEDDLHRGPPFVTVTAEQVRDRLLYAINTAAIATTTDESEKPAQSGDLILKMAQAYLLLDPLVQPGAAANALAELHQGAEDVLGSARGSRPLPKPRPGS